MRIPSPPPLLAYLTTGAYARLPPGDSGPHAKRHALSCDRSCRTPFGRFAASRAARAQPSARPRSAERREGRSFLFDQHTACVRERRAGVRAALTLPGVSRWLPHCVGSSIPPGAIHKSSTELKPLAGQIPPVRKVRHLRLGAVPVLSRELPHNLFECPPATSDVTGRAGRSAPIPAAAQNRMDTRVAAGRASPGRMPP